MKALQKQLDDLYNHHQYQEAYQWMQENIKTAILDNNIYKILWLYNELIGFLRVHSKFEEANEIVNKALELLKNNKISQLSQATTLLNIATLYNEENKFFEAKDFYFQVYNIYVKQISSDDERWYSLLNNLSTLFFKMGDIKQAIDYEYQVLAILTIQDDNSLETAITCTNLAQYHYHLKQYQESYQCLLKALNIFESKYPEDQHYFAALSFYAQWCYHNHQLFKAKDIYLKVLDGIEQLFGKNQDYQIVYENYQMLEKQINQSFGLNLCESYYYEVGKPMLQDKFSKYLKYMAIGLVGMGSECLGFDDELSQDHDFGPGFCIWLPLKIYNQIGNQLQVEYDHLNNSYRGYKRQVSKHGQGRVGVFCIEKFFMIPPTLKYWLVMDENTLCVLTSGRIFEDYYGEVTNRRKQLAYYPEDVRIKKLVSTVAKMSQSGQYNYERCIKRRDLSGAYLCLTEFIKQTISCVYLLNKIYQPFYKWAFKGLENILLLSDVVSYLHQIINEKPHELWINDYCQYDPICLLIESICQSIDKELKKQKLTNQNHIFLENHTDFMMQQIQDEEIKKLHIMEG